MEVDFGGQVFNLDNPLEISLPFILNGVDLLIDICVSPLEKYDILTHYICGDIVDPVGNIMANNECAEISSVKITINISSPQSDYQPKAFVAVACKDHAISTVFQVLVMLGIVLSNGVVRASRDDFSDDDEV